MNVVHLLPGDAPPGRRPPAGPHARRKVAVRWMAALDTPLRMLARNRGDLSALVMRALAEVDTAAMPLVDIRGPKRPETCLMLTPEAHAALARVAEAREASQNVILNTAVAHWLAAQGWVSVRP